MKSEVSKNFKKDGKNSPVFKSDDGAVIEIIEVSKNKKIAELKINEKVIRLKSDDSLVFNCEQCTKDGIIVKFLGLIFGNDLELTITTYI